MAAKKNKEAENTEKEVVEAEVETEVETEVESETGTETAKEEKPVTEPEAELKEEAAVAEKESVEEAEPELKEEAAVEEPEAEPKVEAVAEEEAAAVDEKEAGEAAPEIKEKGKKKGKSKKDELPPGAHLEPILLEEEKGREETDEDVAARYAAELEASEEQPKDEEKKEEEEGEDEEKQGQEIKPVKLDAGKAFQATGKRKRSIARINLKAGSGEFVVNGHTLEEYFPRDLLRFQVLQPLQACKAMETVDIVALVHGGGISGQAQAVGHGIARALVSADPELRGILKKRGHLTRDARVKERRKAGFKKARKRPQFSKR